MESIAELRKICQTTAQKDRSNVYMRYVSRFFSIYLTRLLLPTPVTANQVSFAMIITGVIASLLLACPSQGIFLLAALLLQFWYILDCCDGEVARYRQFQQSSAIVADKRNSSMAGAYYDIINHYIINFLVPLMIGYGLFLMDDNFLYLNLGIAGSLGQILTLAMHDGRSRVLLAQVRKYESVRIATTVKEMGNTPTAPKKRSLPHTIFMIIHYTMTYPTVMNLVIVTAVLNVLVPVMEWRVPLLIYLAVGSLLVSVIFISRTIAKRTIEDEFQNGFLPSENKINDAAVPNLGPMTS